MLPNGILGIIAGDPAIVTRFLGPAIHLTFFSVFRKLIDHPC
jgi:hypothetical protein